MLKQVSVTEEKKEYFIVVGQQEIPIKVIGMLLRPLLILAILWCAYVIGQTDAIKQECNERLEDANVQIRSCIAAGHYNYKNGAEPLNLSIPSPP